VRRNDDGLEVGFAEQNLETLVNLASMRSIMMCFETDKSYVHLLH
jgi:hypothetical protein